MFDPYPDGRTRITLSAQFDLRSKVLERMVEPILRGITVATVTAFEARAARLHGDR
ncbi:hypothetical protein [Chelativorans xinjiangense]|uniref:hypothetical protein n=1 Tax=Chelativorans xinjiangense TaxID=2681485 RepID=UPI003CCCF6AF